MGPPPMPRKLEKMPRTRPISTQGRGDVMLWVVILALKMV